MAQGFVNCRGFTLVELIAVMVIAGILAVAAVGRMMSPNVHALQSARDQTLLCIHSAQQLAMSQQKSVRVLLGGTSLDVRKDANSNGVFASDESVLLGAIQFPVALTQGVTVANSTLDFNSLGETTASTITLSLQSRSLSINVSATGFAR
jgi:MSHA pilin protein MshC